MVSGDPFHEKKKKKYFMHMIVNTSEDVKLLTSRLPLMAS